MNERPCAESTPDAKCEAEFAAADKFVKELHAEGDDAVKELLGEGGGKTRLNLDHSDIVRL